MYWPLLLQQRLFYSKMKPYLNPEDIFWKLWQQSKILIRCFHWRIAFPHHIHILGSAYFAFFSSHRPNSLFNLWLLEFNFYLKRLTVSVFEISPQTTYFRCTMKRVCSVSTIIWCRILDFHPGNRVQKFAEILTKRIDGKYIFETWMWLFDFLRRPETQLSW